MCGVIAQLFVAAKGVVLSLFLECGQRHDLLFCLPQPLNWGSFSHNLLAWLVPLKLSDACGCPAKGVCSVGILKSHRLCSETLLSVLLAEPLLFPACSEGDSGPFEFFQSSSFELISAQLPPGLSRLGPHRWTDLDWH